MLKSKKWEKRWCVLLAVLLVVIIIMPMNPLVVCAADEYDGLREKYKIKLTGYDPANPYDPNDQYIKLSLEKLNEDVNKYWSTMNAVYTWDDLMESSGTSAEDMFSIICYLKTMSLGWATYGSAYCGDPELLSDIINGLEWFYNNRYNETTNWYSTINDWWYWEIGIPIRLNDVVVLLYDRLTPAQITKYMNAVNRWSPDVYTSSILPSTSSSMTGANRVWKCKVIGIWAILTKDSVKLQESSDGLDDVFLYTISGDGFYADGSFIQHWNYPYAGGYGKSLFTDISELLWLLSGSTWDNDSPNRVNVYKWFFDTFEPEMLKGEIFSSVRGRDISRSSLQASSGFDIINSLILLSEIASNPYASEFKSIIKYHLQNGYQDSYLMTCGSSNVVKAKCILEDTNVIPSTELTGNYQFYNQDRVVHRSQGWAFDVAMHSNRIRNYESINNENLKNWYTADGMTYLYINPSDYAFNFWPTVDPHRLPGITVDRDISRPDFTSTGSKSTNSWVGGVSLLNTYGSAGMDFKQHDYSNMDLTAKKSWFMFDDEIVSLGAGINSTSGRTIETVVDNRSLNSQGSNPLTVNGTAKPSTLGWSETMDNVNWIHLDGTGGYVFPNGTSLNGLRERREGNWCDINQLYYDMANDEFDNTAQGPAWMWVREDNAKHGLTGTALNIATQQGTLEGTVNTTKNIVLAKAPQYDFYSETKLDFSPTVVGQEAGLILYTDDDNYMYISRANTASGQKITAVSENGGIALKNSFSDTYGATVYFKIEKCGSDYSLYASSDGQIWGTALYTYSNNMAGEDGVNSTLKMGLFAQNGDNASVPEITASFDYFHLKLIRNYLTLWEDHGVNPVDGTYSYITLPNKTAQEVSDYSSNPDISILKNDANIQAVKENTLGITGANFFNGGSVSYIKAYNPSAVMVKDENSQLDITVSDPTHSQSAVKVELNKKGISVVSSDPTVTVLQLSPYIILEVDVTGENATKGETHNIAIPYDSSVPESPFPTLMQLTASEDAYVRDGSYSDTNYGTNTTFVVKNSGTSNDGGNREAFLKFNMNSISENITEINSAKLYFYGCSFGETGIDVKAYSVDGDNWTETGANGITWNSKPNTNSYLGTVYVDNAMNWRDIDVTSYVRSQYEGDKTITLSLLQDVTGLYSEFKSRENMLIYRPYLEITAMSTPPEEISSFDAIPDVQAGTVANTVYAKAAAVIAALPRSVTANSNAVTVPVSTWVDTDGYNPNVAGSYTFTATPGTIPAGFKNTGNHKATLEVVVLPIKLTASEDAYVRDGSYADTNYGADTKLAVKYSVYSNSGYNREAFLKFNINSLNENITEINSAKLYFYGCSFAETGMDATGVDVKAYSVDDDNWIETGTTGITWNSKPDISSYLGTVYVDNVPDWRNIDVTSYVGSQYEGDKIITLSLLQGGTGLYSEFKSRENVNKPYLEITAVSTPPEEISSFDAIADVQAGTVANTVYADVAAVIAALPKSVTANNNEVKVPATTWVDTDEYNPNVAGSYTFTATLGDIPSGFANTGNYTSTVEVVVSPIKLTASEDAYVRDGSFADTNYGADTTLVVKYSVYSNYGYNREAFLKFNIDSLSENITEINSAKLYFYGCSFLEAGVDATGADVKAYSIDDNWTETGTNGITWNNKPNTSEYLGTVYVDNTMNWRVIDVTSYVQSQYEGDKTITLSLLQDVNGLYSQFNSRENINKPYLEITAVNMPLEEISSFDAIADIQAGTVGNTVYTDVAAVVSVLPKSVTANNNSVTVPVSTWVDTDGYNPNVAGSYTFTATLGDIPSGFANTGNHTATAEVIVSPLILTASEDAYVRDGSYADTNYGADTKLAVKYSVYSNSGYNREAFLKFNINSLNENITEINSAKLYFYGCSFTETGVDATGVDVNAYSVDDDNWTETGANGITWNSKPNTSEYLGTAYVDNTTNWSDIDVTSYVQSQYEGDKIITLSLLQDGTGLYSEFKSRENVNKPYLAITAVNTSPTE